jgi:hypothetical protein
MGGFCGRVWERVNVHRISLNKLEGNGTLKDLEIDGMIIFK